MTEYNSNGYDDVRSYVYNNHNWLALIDDTGSEILRLDLNADSRVTENSGPASNPIEYTITITGQDIQNAGFSLPLTLTDGEVHETSSTTASFATDALKDANGNATQATLEAETDEVAINFTNEWPDI